MFIKAVKLAHLARTQNMSSDEVMSQTINEKARLVHSGILQYAAICTGNQVNQENYSVVFDHINLGLINGTPGAIVTDADIKTGLKMFSILIYCPTAVLTLYDFLHTLVSSQSARTIIQTTVNTIQSDNIMGTENRQNLNQFYLALDKIFNFQIGKILLATSSLQDLQAMMAKDWPYFFHYYVEIDQCLNGASCQGVSDLIQTIGRVA